MYLGLREVESRLPVDRDTVFFVASLTKAITATALGMLVNEGRLEWDTPVHDILPAMSKDTELYLAKLNVVDILCHRTGKAWAAALYLQSNNRILLPKDEAIRTFDYLPQVEPVRSKFMYNNHAYNLAGLVVERLSGQSWADFLREHIFDQLAMSRTFTSHPAGDANVAAAYNVLSSRVPARLPFCNADGSTLMFAGQSVRMSMGDMLKYSAAHLRSLQELQPDGDIPAASGEPVDVSRATSILGRCRSALASPRRVAQADEARPARKDSIIRQIATLVAPHVLRNGVPGTLLEQTYALGRNRTQLPGSLDFGWNSHVPGRALPQLGRAYPGRLALWHGGNMPGTTAALCLLPETGTAVVVMQNSLGLCDVADLVCQLVIDTLFAGAPQEDYLGLAQECVRKGILRMDEVERTLAAGRVSGTSPRNLDSYTGRYYNSIGNWFLDIKLAPGGDGDEDGAEKQHAQQLCLEFPGRADERYYLRHYHHDSFVWNLSYDETVKRGQYVRAADYYRLDFQDFGTVPTDGKAAQLLWRHDKSVPRREVFTRAMGSGPGANS